MNTVYLFLSLMLSLRKNLFFERFAFLKSNSTRRNSILFGAWFFLKEILFPLALLFLLLTLLHEPAVAFCLICAIMIFKLIRVDNYDWKLYSRADFQLAFPTHTKRYASVLVGNLLKGLLIEDFTPVYVPALVLFSKVSFPHAVCIYLIFLGAYVGTLNYYFLLQSGNLKTKRCYALLSYVSSMSITAGIAYGIVSLMIRFVRGGPLSSLHTELPNLFQRLLNAVKDLLNSAYQQALGLNHKIWWSACIGVILLALVSGVAALQREAHYKSATQTKGSSPRLPHIGHRNGKDMPFMALLQWKENRLFSHLYQYQFRQYWYVVLFDRSTALLLGMWASLFHYRVDRGGYLLYAFGLLLFSLELSSQINVKLLTNLSFLSDYGTLRLANTNGIPIQLLVKAKLQFFYRVRLLPTLAFLMIALACLVTTGLPSLLLPVYFAVCLFQLWIYPKVFFTNNLINTRMDYKDYEKYLEESKLLDTGAEDFFPISLSYRIRALLVFACVIAGLFFHHEIYLYVSLSLALIGIGLVEHLLMRRILRNIVEFVQRGEYSADVKKIFSQSGHKF